VTAPRMSRPPITVRRAYGHGSGDKRIKTLRGPDGGERPRDRAVQGSMPSRSAVKKGFSRRGGLRWVTAVEGPIPPVNVSLAPLVDCWERQSYAALGPHHGACTEVIFRSRRLVKAGRRWATGASSASSLSTRCSTVR
jgi:hypothetical protein